MIESLKNKMMMNYDDGDDDDDDDSLNASNWTAKKTTMVSNFTALKILPHCFFVSSTKNDHLFRLSKWSRWIKPLNNISWTF